jgi:hypothetical protein
MRKRNWVWIPIYNGISKYSEDNIGPKGLTYSSDRSFLYEIRIKEAEEIWISNANIVVVCGMKIEAFPVEIAILVNIYLWGIYTQAKSILYSLFFISSFS